MESLFRHKAHKPLSFNNLLWITFLAITIVFFITKFIFVESAWARQLNYHLDSEEYCGELKGYITWNAGVYHIVCPLTVTVDSTLIIEKGAIIEFNTNSSLHVYGSFVVKGTEDEPVVFTSYTSSPYPGYWESSLPLPGAWDAIYFYPGSNGAIDWATIEYGGTNAYGNVHIFGGEVIIQNSTIRFSSKSGVFSNVWVSLLDNHFINNSREAVRLDINGESTKSARIQGNRGKGNGENRIRIQGEVNIDVNLGRNPGLPYVIDFLTINPQQTLSLNKGTLIKLSRSESNDASLIEVRGSLVTQGSEFYPVVFTSTKDNEFEGWYKSDMLHNENGEYTNLLFVPLATTYVQPYSKNYHEEPQNFEEPAGGDWRGIVVLEGGQAVLSHTVIRYSGYPHSQLTILSGSGALDYVKIEKGYLNGIYAEDTSLVLQNCVVSEHPGYGVKIHGKSKYIEPILEGNEFNNNGTYGLYIILNGGGIGNGRISDNRGSGNGMVNGIYVEGYITDQISQWDANPDFPYVIWTVTVQPNAKLMIKPGVVIKFINPPTNPENEIPFERGRGCFIINGVFEAIGTLSQPIVFTSYWDDDHGGDTNGGYGGNEPLPGDWWSFIIRSEGVAHLAYTHFLYGGNDGMAVRVDGGELTMTNSVVKHSRNVGVGGTGTIYLTYSLVAENGGNGVQLNGPSTVQWNVIIDNEGYGLVNYYNPSKGYVAIATNNYWGSSDGPSSDNLPCPYSTSQGHGSKVGCLVDWDPYLPEIPAEVSELLSNFSN